MLDESSRLSTSLLGKRYPRDSDEQSVRSVAQPKRARIEGPKDADDAGPHMTIYMRVPGIEVGHVIGRKGENINSMRNRHHCYIHFDRKLYRGTGDQICTIKGRLSDILSVMREIRHIVAIHCDCNIDYPEEFCKCFEIRLVIPSSACGYIIGKGGCNIKRIRENHKFYFRIHPENGTDQAKETTDRTIVIKSHGDEFSVVREIGKLMVKDPAYDRIEGLEEMSMSRPLSTNSSTASSSSSCYSESRDGFVSELLAELQSRVRTNGFNDDSMVEINQAIQVISRGLQTDATKVKNIEKSTNSPAIKKETLSSAAIKTEVE